MSMVEYEASVSYLREVSQAHSAITLSDFDARMRAFYLGAHGEQEIGLRRLEAITGDPRTRIGDKRRCRKQSTPYPLSRCVWDQGHDGECMCVAEIPARLKVSEIRKSVIT
jgi:hypothetical protein